MWNITQGLGYNLLRKKMGDCFVTKMSWFLNQKSQLGGSDGFKKKTEKSAIIEIICKFYATSSKATFQEDLETKAKELIRAKRNNFAEKECDDWNKLKGEGFELEKKSEIVSRTCPLGLQHSFCKHKVGVTIKNKIISVPKSLNTPNIVAPFVKPIVAANLPEVDCTSNQEISDKMNCCAELREFEDDVTWRDWTSKNFSRS